MTTKLGRILVAGNWAREAPYAYNPSYASPAAYAVLARASGDRRWTELAEGSRRVTAAMLDEVDLPPDWAQVKPDGSLDPMPGAAGRGSEGVRYGYDATRLPLRYAESCDPADVTLAARLGDALDRFAGQPAARDLGGRPLGTDESVVAAVGQAAVAAARGNPDRSRAELAAGDALQQRRPTYYGAAWDALGRLLLTDPVLGGCPTLRSRTGPRPLAGSEITVSSLRIDDLDLRSRRIESLDLEADGALAAPTDPDRPGWYAGGTLPGDQGPAILAGHLDSKTGPAVFARLRTLQPGAVIVVGRSDGREVEFTVTAVITTPKEGFPTDRVFGPTPDTELRLITCGGPYDRVAGSYQDNTVIFATAR